MSNEKSGHKWNIISQFPCMCNDGKFFGKEEVEEMFKSSKGKTWSRENFTAFAES